MIYDESVLCQRASEEGGYQRVPRRSPPGGFPDSGVRPKPIYSWMLMNHGGSISIYISIYSISISSPMGDDI